MKKKIIISLFLFIIIISSIVLYSRYIGTKGLVVREYKVIKNDLDENYHGLKIIQISDIHYYSTIYEKELENVVNKINFIKPDLVLFTGDLITYNKIDEVNIDILTNILKKIDATIGKYAISGNHDIKNYDEFKLIMKNADFEIIDDKYIYVYKDSYNPILITGLSSNIESKVNIKDRFYNINIDNDISTAYNILLLHEPDFIKDIDYSSYDLILSGHSHNGQVRIPVIGALYTPYGSKRYYDPFYQLDDTKLYISGGLGTSLYNFRLFTKPSFNFFRITKK